MNDRGFYLRRHPWAIILILWAVCIIRGVLYVSINPVFEGPDETMHYSYIQELCEHQRLPVYGRSMISREIDLSINYLPTAGMVTLVPQPSQNISIPRHEDYWTISDETRESMRKKLDRIPRGFRKKDSTTEQYEAHHPPLYYALCTPVYKALEHKDLIDILYAIRLFSALVASLTVPLGYLALRAWFPVRPRLSVIVMTIVVFMPVFYFDTARIGNDSFGVPLFTALLWASGVCWRGNWKPRESLALGFLLGLGLLTKAYFLAAIPPVLLLYLIKFIQERPSWKTTAANLGILLSCMLAVGGWWYVRNIIVYGGLTGLPEAAALGSVSAFHWVDALGEINLFRFLRRIIDTHLWPGNWSLLDLPKPVEKMFRFLLLAGLIGFVISVIRNFFKNRTNISAWSPLILIFFYLFFLAAMLFHTLQAWGTFSYIQTGGWFLCALIVIEVAMLVQGVDFLLSGLIFRFRAYFLFIAFFIVIDLFGIFFRIIPYYTGLAVKDEHHGLVFFPVPADLLELGQIAITRLTVNKPAWISQNFVLLLGMVVLLIPIFVTALILLADRSVERKKKAAVPQPAGAPMPRIGGIRPVYFGLLIFGASLLQGFLWATITPPLQAPDEPAHFGYVQHLGENDLLSLPTAPNRLSQELAGVSDMLKLDKIKFNNASNFNFTSEETISYSRKIDEMPRSSRTTPSEMNNTASHYPPLYYWFGSLGYRLFYDKNILSRFFSTRIVSVLMTALSLLVAFFAARRFFKNDEISARTAVLLLLFHPMYAYIGSCVNCDAMLYLVSMIVLYLFIRILQEGPTWKLQSAVCICIAAGLLTKPTFAAMVPLWILVVGITNLRKGLDRRKTLMHLGFTLAVLTVAGLLYVQLGRRHLAFWLTSMQAGSVGEHRSFLNYLGYSFLNLIRPWTLMCKRLLTSYWANFGWKDTPFPHYGIYLLAYLSLIAAGLHAAYRILKRPETWHKGQNGLISFSLLGSIIFSAGIIVMGFTIAHDAWESGNLQGRYFFPVILLNMLVMTAGLVHCIKNDIRKRQVAVVLVSSMMLWHFASYLLVIERFYL